MSMLAGVDVGASHTEAVVSDESLVVAARKRGPGAALHPGKLFEAVESIAATIRAALNARRTGSSVDAVVVGCAGAGREDLRAGAEQGLRAALGSGRVVVTTDGLIALESAFGDAPGIVLCAGSGSIAYARHADGTVFRAGGLGLRLGDKGCGFALGRAALRSAAAAADGRGPPTSLSEAIANRVEAASVDRMKHWADTADPPAVADLARVVCDEARGGDAVALALAEQAARDLCDLVASLVEHFPGEGPVDVALSGGLMSEGSVVREALVRLLGALVPRVRHADVTVDPPSGALALALRLLTQ